MGCCDFEYSHLMNSTSVFWWINLFFFYCKLNKRVVPYGAAVLRVVLKIRSKRPTARIATFILLCFFISWIFSFIYVLMQILFSLFFTLKLVLLKKISVCFITPGLYKVWSRNWCSSPATSSLSHRHSLHSSFLLPPVSPSPPLCNWCGPVRNRIRQSS